MKKKIVPITASTVIIFGIIFTLLGNSGKYPNPRGADLKQDQKSIRYENKEKKGCCKIKYPSGGYDFFESTEEECRNNLYFDRFLGDRTSLCFQWRD